MLLLPNTTLSGGAALAETLREVMEQTPCLHEGRSIAVTVSIGVCGAYLENASNWDYLIQAADQALYRAKAAGRNRVECADLPRRAYA